MQALVGGVAGGEPKDLRGRAEAVEQAREVGVFGQDDDAGLLGGAEYCLVLGIAQAQVANGYGLQGELPVELRGQQGRQLGVEPDGHAASRG